jgi:hypothetical protein
VCSVHIVGGSNSFAIKRCAHPLQVCCSERQVCGGCTCTGRVHDRRVCRASAHPHTSPLPPSRRGCKAQVSGKTGTVTLSDRLRSLLRQAGTLGCCERNGTRTIQGMVGVPGRSAVAIAPRAMGRAKNRQDQHDEQQHGALYDLKLELGTPQFKAGELQTFG